MVRVLSGTGFLLMAPLCTGAHRAGTYPVRMRIATVNVNGIRAAARKGMAAWLEAGAPDVLLLQEVRADADTAAALLPGYRSLVWPSRIRGRAGVGVAVREDGPLTLGRARYGVADGAEEPDVDSGRWLEADLEPADGAGAAFAASEDAPPSFRTEAPPSRSSSRPSLSDASPDPASCADASSNVNDGTAAP